MKCVRRRRRKGRRLYPETKTVKPTAQTLARMTSDPLWLMLQRGFLTQEQVDAAHDIRDAFELVTAPARLRTMPTIATVEGRVFDLSTGRTPAGGFGYDHETVRGILLQERFSAWSKAMHGQHWSVGPVLDVVVLSQPCRRVDGLRNRRNGSTAVLLRQALDLYVTLKRDERRPIVPPPAAAARPIAVDGGEAS
ncbi:MAG: hypothetical protein FJX65_14850 [Alphaproteobacteria bacterium]|nr:hypothetical protein [Alphaproteobacteria bacterium]